MVQERGATTAAVAGPHRRRHGCPELSESQLNIIRNRDAIVERLRALGPEAADA
jgi:hypothetical protein